MNKRGYFHLDVRRGSYYLLVDSRDEIVGRLMIDICERCSMDCGDIRHSEDGESVSCCEGKTHV